MTIRAGVSETGLALLISAVVVVFSRAAAVAVRDAAVLEGGWSGHGVCVSECYMMDDDIDDVDLIQRVVAET